MNPWDLPPQQGVVNGPRDITNPDKGGPPQVQSLVYNYGVIKPGSNVYGWVTINRVDVYDDAGEHAPGYDKAYRWGAAPVWGRCIEVRDWSGRGALWGLEIDALSKGRDPDHGRRGLGIVLGRNMPGDERPFYDYGVDVLPLGGDPDQARVGTAYHTSVPCENFAAAPPGSWITLDRDKAIGFTFDEATGFINFGLKGQQPGVQIHVATGEILSRGRKVMGPV